jgi:hypothetical protein
LAASSSNKQPLLVDRPASSSTLLTVASGQLFATSLIPTAVGNATKVFDVDSALTDTSISGAYIDEIYLRYTKDVNLFVDAKTALTGTYVQSNDGSTSGTPGTVLTVTVVTASTLLVTLISTIPLTFVSTVLIPEPLRAPINSCLCLLLM